MQKFILFWSSSFKIDRKKLSAFLILKFLLNFEKIQSFLLQFTVSIPFRDLSIQDFGDRCDSEKQNKNH